MSARERSHSLLGAMLALWIGAFLIRSTMALVAAVILLGLGLVAAFLVVRAVARWWRPRW